ncbi:LruC domain-containing protein [Bacteroides sp.]|uniref:LruC domain-containing protein n=1 Tax=Bacteroides sp. TaxID=29523 RepID=UPI002628C368|nr:LruC domain-containing protein [Bacteroides sp.]
MKKALLGFAALATICLTQSCMHDISNIEEPPATNDFKDLKVSPIFDWVTSKNITCTVNSDAPTKVEIYTDEACEEELLATFITQEGSNQLAVSIAQATNKLYLKYTTSSDATKILTTTVSNGTATFSVTGGAQVLKAESRNAMTRADDMPIFDGGAYISYPAKWGTVMFEDQFPALGDYDFNDFVASYQIALEFPWDGEKYNTELVHQVRVHLRLKAIGGILKFTPYVRIVGLNKSIVSMPNPAYNRPEYPNPKILNNTIDKVETSLVESPLTNDVIVEFKNLNASNPYAVKDSPYYNTTQGKTTKDNQLTEVWVYLALSKEMKTSDLLDNNIDIFLASDDKTKEIHLRGFKPVFSEYDYNLEGISKDTPYASDKNLIWGLKVAYPIPHAVERANFCTVYRNFASWAESDGNSNLDWYDSNTDQDNLIKWAK